MAARAAKKNVAANVPLPSLLAMLGLGFIEPVLLHAGRKLLIGETGAL
jgi:hypothetical protein